MSPPDWPITLPRRWRKPPNERGAPCSFCAGGLNFVNYAQAKTWYDHGLSWRYEMGSQRTSLRYNRACMASFCRVHRPRPRWAFTAARAGMERAIWELTGKLVKLSKRCKNNLSGGGSRTKTLLHFIERPLFHEAHPDDGYKACKDRCPNCALAVNPATGQRFLLWQHDGVHWSLSRHDPAYGTPIRLGDIELVGEPNGV